MTIGQTEPVNIVYGNNLATKFDYDFYIETEEQLVVEHTNFSGVTTVLTYGVDYSIDGIGNEDGGQINFPLQGSTYQTLGWNESTDEKEVLVISLSLPFEQAAEFDISGDLNKKNLEKALDYQMRCTQILKRSNDRAMKVPEGAKINLSLPNPKANNTFAWNDDCSALVNYDIIGENNSFKNQMANTFAEAKVEFNSMIEANKQEIFDLQQGYELELNEKFQTVADAADKINTLDETIEDVKNVANKATQINQDTQVQTENALAMIDSKIAKNDTSMQQILSDTETTAQAINEAFENFTEQTESTLAYSLKKNQITNCIKEKPRRIKYTYENGTFTLKAGSQVIVPNGVGKFDYVTIANDMSVSSYSAGNSDCVMFYNSAAKTFNFYVLGLNIFSGTSTPTVTDQWNIWYDTANNIMKKSNDTGATWYTHDMESFPIAILSRSAGNFTALKQVFNGIGYIGSTIWEDKDIVYLMPDGFNDDGTYKNFEYKTTGVTVTTTSNQYPHFVGKSSSGGLSHIVRIAEVETCADIESVAHTTLIYVKNENKQYYKDSKSVVTRAYTVVNASFDVEQTAPYAILNFKAVRPFGVADYNKTVSKTGDTMTGALLLDNADLTVVNSNLATIHIKNRTFDITTTGKPSTALTIGRITMRDKNNQVPSFIQLSLDTNGTLKTTLATQRIIGDAITNCQITAGVLDTGVPYTYANNCSNNGCILTQAAMSKSQNGYLKLGNGIILQWGVTSTGTSGTITFPTAFTSTNYSINFTERGISKLDLAYTGIKLENYTTTTIKWSRTDSCSQHWFAIGY